MVKKWVKVIDKVKMKELKCVKGCGGIFYFVLNVFIVLGFVMVVLLVVYVCDLFDVLIFWFLDVNCWIIFYDKEG